MSEATRKLRCKICNCPVLTCGLVIVPYVLLCAECWRDVDTKGLIAVSEKEKV